MRTSAFSSVSVFGSFVGLVSILAFAEGCAPSLAQPFDQMKAANAPITVYRLQNFEPPQQPQAQAAAAPQVQVPPQIQQWLTAGAAMLPPGLIPPGLLPGSTVVPPPATQEVARFHNFRILGWMALTDAKQREEVLSIFGTAKNFQQPKTQCMYAEFGFSIGNGQMPPSDILVSLSCDQAQGFNFMWPYGVQNGFAPGTAQRIVSLVNKTFGG